MALETLDGIEKIGGFSIYRDNNAYYDDEENENNEYIGLVPKANTIVFKLQKGPIKDVGVNGCQVDTLIETAKLILIGLNEKFPSTYNKLAIAYLQEALHNLAARKKDREARGVEGTNAE